jgi:hypothetical protein
MGLGYIAGNFAALDPKTPLSLLIFDGKKADCDLFLRRPY